MYLNHCICFAVRCEGTNWNIACIWFLHLILAEMALFVSNKLTMSSKWKVLVFNWISLKPLPFSSQWNQQQQQTLNDKNAHAHQKHSRPLRTLSYYIVLKISYIFTWDLFPVYIVHCRDCTPNTESIACVLIFTSIVSSYLTQFSRTYYHTLLFTWQLP